MGKHGRSSRHRHDGSRTSVAIDGADYGTKQIEHELAAQGLYIKEITGDGNCLFRSLADQLGESGTHAQIRHDVVDFLRRNRDEFAGFVEEDYDRYVDRMSQDGVYGDNMEIVAFSRVRNRSVCIYQPGLSYVINPPEDGRGTSEGMLHIVYHSYEHYSSVRNKDGPHDGPPDVRPLKLDVPALKELSADAPATDLEKICMASVPTMDLTIVREVLKSCRGNVNIAIDQLLERQCEQDAIEALPISDSPEEQSHSLDAPSPTTSLPGDERKLGIEHDHVDDAAPRSKPLKASLPGKRKGLGREKKEHAKKAQKEAARERKRKLKTRPESNSGSKPVDQVRTIGI